MVKILLVLVVLGIAMVLYGRVLGRRDSGRSLRDLSEAARAKISEEVRAGQKVAAVKTYRDATGAALVDAKRAIDDWFVPGRGLGVVQKVRQAMDGELTLEARKRISALVEAGQRDEAMRLYSEATGAGSAEAQAIIRTWDTNEHI